MINNVRANLISFDVIMQEEETQINGVILIADFRNFGLAQTKAIEPLRFRKYGQIIMNHYPLRIKGIHVLHQPAIFTVIYSIISKFMKQKLRERVKLHGGNINGLQEFVAKEVIPKDFGGDGAATDLRCWPKYIMEAEADLEHLLT